MELLTPRLRLLASGPFEAAEARARSARALDRFARHAEAHAFSVSAVTDRATGRLIGQCGLLHLPDGSDIEVLYALARAAWGQGLATEAARAVLTHPSPRSASTAWWRSRTPSTSPPGG